MPGCKALLPGRIARRDRDTVGATSMSSHVLGSRQDVEERYPPWSFPRSVAVPGHRHVRRDGEHGRRGIANLDGFQPGPLVHQRPGHWAFRLTKEDYKVWTDCPCPPSWLTGSWARLLTVT